MLLRSGMLEINEFSEMPTPRLWQQQSAAAFFLEWSSAQSIEKAFLFPQRE